MGLDKGGGVCMQWCAVQSHCLLCRPEGGVLDICFYIGFWFCDVLVHSFFAGPVRHVPCCLACFAPVHFISFLVHAPSPYFA